MEDFKSLPADELRARATNLVESYPADLEPSFVDEFVQFTFLVMTERDQNVVHMSEMLKADGDLLQATFPNVGIALSRYSSN